MVEFERDALKARANQRKHRVDFADAVAVLGDSRAVTIADEDVTEEERFVTIGTDPLGRILVVAFIWRGDRIRVISARKATRRERRVYGARR